MKKVTKKLFSLLVVFAILFSCYIPLTRVFADGDYVITFSVNGNHTMENDGGHLKIDGQIVDLRDANDDNVNIGTVACNNNTCTVTVSDGTPGKLNFNSANKFTLFMQGHEFDMNHTFTANENIAVQDYVDHPQEQQGGGENEPHFDGRAVVLWSCGEGVCYHEFGIDPETEQPEIKDFPDGNSTFFKDTAIKADNDESIHFDVHAEYKAWALTDKFNLWVEAYKSKNKVDVIDWTQVDPEEIISEFPPDMRHWEEEAINVGKCVKPQEGDPGNVWDEFESCVDDYYIKAGNLPFIRLQPLGEPSANNAYVSYGDRNFKVVIYNDDYRGLTLGDLTDLDYYPAHWTNPFLKVDQYDISGTTEDKPALMDSILLEDEVHFKTLKYNNYSIVSVEALDVPKDAVEILEEDEEYVLRFKSNFYDHVLFKITDNSEREYYVRIDRYTIDAYLNYVWEEDPSTQHPAITAEFYFERDKNYDDFNLTAKIIYKDGTVKNIVLEAIKEIDDGLGNITKGVYQVDQEISGNDPFGNPLPAGKGLNKSVFRYDLENGEENEIERIFVNAEYAEDLGEGTYAGAYTGSGEGVKVKMGGGE